MANNEKRKKGNPFQRGNTWTIIYYVKDSDGKNIQKWKGGYKTKKEAEKALAVFKAQATLSLLPIEDNTTVEDWMVQWFEVHKTYLQPSTVLGYKNNIERYIIPYLGKIKIKSLKVSTLEKFYNMLLDEHKLKPKTIKYIHNVLKVALEAAVNDKQLSENVCVKARTPKVERYVPTLLTVEQLRLFLSKAVGHKYEAEFNLAVKLGLRRGEVLGLKYSDFDFERHTVTINRQVTVIRSDKNKELYGLKKPKSESSHRILFISKDIEDLIKRKRVWYDYNKKRLGSDFEDSDLVCCKEDGTIRSPQSLYTAFKYFLKKCDLPDVRFHDLRHSYAVLCIDMNVPIKVLSQALGHSSTSVTDSVYADSIAVKQKLTELVCKAICDELEKKE